MSPETARALPAVAKCLSVITGLVMQMPMQAMKGRVIVEPTPTVLRDPDPTRDAASFVQSAVEDYLLNGNCLVRVTSRSAAGYPLSVEWLPAQRMTLTIDRDGIQYWFDGHDLDVDDVVHIRRGAHPMFVQRGIGVVEQHLSQLGKVAAQERFEKRTLDGGAVPSVAVIAPNQSLSQSEADIAKETWVSKYGGATREPAILPNGTQVVPLAWSPADSEMTDARKLSLLDVANIFGLDGYWVGAPTSSMTYRSPGPMFLSLLRQTVAPILTVFEQVWGKAWLPHGTDLRFHRQAVLTDDMGTMITYIAKAVASGLWTPNEGREWMGMPPATDPDADQLSRHQITKSTLEGQPDDPDQA